MESKELDHTHTFTFVREVYISCLSEGKNGLKRYLKNRKIGDRVRRAMRVVSERRLIKAVLPSGSYIWLFNGKDSTHLIIPFKYCSCMDFLMHTVTKSITPACYHLIAQALAEAFNNYITLSLSEDELITIVNEINTRDLSITLKRKIREARRSN